MPSSTLTASQEHGSSEESASKQFNGAEDCGEIIRAYKLTYDSSSPNRGTDPGDRSDAEASPTVLILGLKRSTHSQGTLWHYLTKPEDMTIQAPHSNLTRFHCTYGDIDMSHSRQLFNGYLYIRYLPKWVSSDEILSAWRNTIWAAVEGNVRDEVKEQFWESVNSNHDFSWNGEELVREREDRTSFHMCVEIGCESCTRL